MAETNDHRSEAAEPRGSASAEAVPAEAKKDSPAATTDHAAQGEQHAAAKSDSPSDNSPKSAENKPSLFRRHKRLLLAVAGVGIVIGAYLLIPWVMTMLNTVSTDDAYVNGHVTFVAPRVSGQVRRVLVDDNYRVKRGDLLVELDKEPYQVQVAFQEAAVTVAEANLLAAQAQTRGQVAQAQANRFRLEHAIEDVQNQIASLRGSVATLHSRQASLELAQQNLRRGEELAPGGGISKEELDTRRQTVKVDQAAVAQALETVYAIRVNLGLPAPPPPGQDLSEVPPELDQDFSVVRQALGEWLQSAAQFGYSPPSRTVPPRQAIEDFYKQDTERNLDRIYKRLIADAPVTKQAEANLLQARRNLDQAKLNLRYCDIVSEIDGVVTRRNVNPGNDLQAGQSLMAVRSLTEIWIDANFKETQLADLRIGQRVCCEVDMYGSRREFEGRISGFTMGTGQTLALLPPQNATGNFVKIVQRLPVRIDLMDYDPDKVPLFVGLSVVPYVRYKEPPIGPHAGEFLQPYASLPQRPTEPTP
jgi:membrane fusion protein, multidrug efflux system